MSEHRNDTVSTNKSKKYDGVSGDEGLSQGKDINLSSINASKKRKETPERKEFPQTPGLRELATGDNAQQSKF